MGEAKKKGFRGQPVIVFGAVLLAWTGMRGTMWENPLPNVKLPDGMEINFTPVLAKSGSEISRLQGTVSTLALDLSQGIEKSFEGGSNIGSGGAFGARFLESGRLAVNRVESVAGAMRLNGANLANATNTSNVAAAENYAENYATSADGQTGLAALIPSVPASGTLAFWPGGLRLDERLTGIFPNLGGALGLQPDALSSPVQMAANSAANSSSVNITSRLAPSLAQSQQEASFINGEMSHQMLFLAAMSRVPLPDHIVSLMQSQNKFASIGPSSTPDLPQRNRMGAARSAVKGMAVEKSEERPILVDQRWTLDSWLFFRPDSGLSGAATNGVGLLPASYGGSQSGAVLHYNFMRRSPLRPAAYLRLTKALSNTNTALDQGEMAAGLAIRPLANIPVSARAELRLREIDGKADFRPAAMIVTHVPPINLPHKFQATTYGQAGYVGGKDSTAFADGQLRVDREVAKFDLGRVKAGAGVWGGAQRGAARLDIGPSASVDVKIGQAPARISMDYRHRVAGDAMPQSGVAITIAASF